MELLFLLLFGSLTAAPSPIIDLDIDTPDKFDALLSEYQKWKAAGGEHTLLFNQITLHQKIIEVNPHDFIHGISPVQYNNPQHQSHSLELIKKEGVSFIVKVDESILEEVLPTGSDGNAYSALWFKLNMLMEAPSNNEMRMVDGMLLPVPITQGAPYLKGLTALVDKYSQLKEFSVSLLFEGSLKMGNYSGYDLSLLRQLCASSYVKYIYVHSTTNSGDVSVELAFASKELGLAKHMSKVIVVVALDNHEKIRATNAATMGLSLYWKHTAGVEVFPTLLHIHSIFFPVSAATKKAGISLPKPHTTSKIISDRVNSMIELDEVLGVWFDYLEVKPGPFPKPILPLNRVTFTYRPLVMIEQNESLLRIFSRDYPIGSRSDNYLLMLNHQIQFEMEVDEATLTSQLHDPGFKGHLTSLTTKQSISSNDNRPISIIQALLFQLPKFKTGETAPDESFIGGFIPLLKDYKREFLIKMCSLTDTIQLRNLTGSLDIEVEIEFVRVMRVNMKKKAIIGVPFFTHLNAKKKMDAAALDWRVLGVILHPKQPSTFRTFEGMARIRLLNLGHDVFFPDKKGTSLYPLSPQRQVLPIFEYIIALAVEEKDEFTKLVRKISIESTVPISINLFLNHIIIRVERKEDFEKWRFLSRVLNSDYTKEDEEMR